MSDTVVVFDHVWKKFRRGEGHNSLRDLVPSMTRRLFSRTPTDRLKGQEFWGVRDVSFEVARGEALGIIGPNGAGKSTTLKLLTKIMRPTRGRCAIKGRVGALIEVAAGFHGDLTGRENVFLQGAIMGMRRAEVRRKLDAIIDFSGLHEFVDTPVKRYSSGMNARLGFSIAANLEPDALIIDEVLAVGDMSFQQRCIERMEEFKRLGVAIVFVSHDLQAVSSLCQRAVFLDGTLRAQGSTADVIREYITAASEAPGGLNDDPIEIISSELLDDGGKLLAEVVAPGAGLILRVSYAPKIAADQVLFDFRVYRASDNLLVYEGHFSNAQVGLGLVSPNRPFQIDFAFNANVIGGQYRVVTLVRDTIMRRFLGQTRSPNTFLVDDLRTSKGLAHLNVKPLFERPLSRAQNSAIREPSPSPADN